MKGPALAATSLLAAAGCNAIFGLSGEIRENDAAMLDVVDPSKFALRVSWQHQGAVDVPVDFPTIVGIDVKYDDLVHGPQPIGIDNSPDPGTFRIPHDGPLSPYHLLFTLDGVTTEVHMVASSGTAHFVVPWLGTLPESRMAPPGGAQITFMPTGGPSQFLNAGLLTLPNWSAMEIGGVANPDVTFNYEPAAVPIGATPRSTLSAANHDYEVLVSYTDSAPYNLYGYAVAQVDHLDPGPVLATSTWQQLAVPATTMSWNGPPQIGPSSPEQRLIDAQGGLHSALSGARHSRYGVGVAPNNGVGPNPNMTLFGAPQPGQLDQPLLFLLAREAELVTSRPLSFKNPFNGTDAPKLQTAVYATDTNTRSVNDGSNIVSLTSGFQMIARKEPTDANAEMSYPVGIPINVKFGSTDLNNDNLTVTRAPVLSLQFNFDTGNADVCLATVYVLDNNALTTVRRFLVLKPPVALDIDASLFDTTHSYTWGISCTIGFPDAVMKNDFSKVAPTMAQSLVYTGTFKVAP